MCTHPLPARRVGGQIEFLGRSDEGRFFSNKAATIQIPCGQCAECKLKRSREWAVRCMHEASLHDENCFLTLTYRDKDVELCDDHSVSLRYRDFQSFLKRLRKVIYPRRISFLACGEYGETNPRTGEKDGGKYRAHFHALIFGYNFPDRVPVRLLDGTDLYKSVVLDTLWGHGDCKIGNLTFESASYVARYAMKKITGDLKETAYTIITSDGEMIERTPEMLVMSKRPAIGKRWFEKFGKYTYYTDKVVARGKEMQPPRYYDKQLPKVILGMIAKKREEENKHRKKDHTDDRNNVRNVVVKAGLNQFRRT